LFVAAAFFWLAATENGTRWLLAQVLPMLPSEMSIAGVDGTLFRGLHLNSVRWHNETLTVSVDSIRTQFELLPLLGRNLNVSVLDVQNVDMVIADLPESDPDEPPFALDLPITVSLDAASIQDIRVAFDDDEYLLDHVSLAGRLSGPDLDLSELSIASDLGDFQLSGNVRLAHSYNAFVDGTWTLRMPEQPSLAGRIELSGDISRYEIQHALTAPHAITTNGWFTVTDGRIWADIENNWDVVNLSMSDGRSVRASNGLLHLVGTAKQFEFDGNATIDTADIPSLSVSINGDSDRNRFNVEALSVANDWGRSLTSGTVTIMPEPTWDLRHEFFDIDPALTNQVLTGQLQLRGSSVGHIAEQKVTASAAVDSLAGQLNGYPVTGSGTLSYDGELLRFKSAHINVGINQAMLDGSYGTRLNLHAALQLRDINQLLPDAAGVVSGEVHLESEPDHAALSGALDATSLVWQDYAVEHIETRFDLPTAGAGRIFLRAQKAQLDKVLFETVSIDGAGSTQSNEIFATIDGPIGRTEFRVVGQYLDELWSGSVKALTMRGEAFGDWALQQDTDLLVSASALKLGRACLVAVAPVGTACIQLDVEAEGPLRFKSSISGLPLTALPMNLPEGSSITGIIEAEADGEFLQQRLQAKADLKILNLSLRAVYEDEELAADFDVATVNASVLDNRLNAELQLTATDKSARANATIELTDIFDKHSQLAGSAALELSDLSLLSFLYPDITKSSGRVGGRMQVLGNLAAPEFVGEIGLQDGAFEVRRAGIAVTDVGLRLRQLETGRLNLDGSAKSGDGHLSVVGTTTLSSTDGIRTQVTLKGEKFALVRLPEWQVTASPAIDVVLDDRAARISGELGIPDADITIHEVPETAEQPSADVIVHRKDETQDTVRRELFVDVRTVLGEAVSLSAFGLTTGLEGAVRITGGSKSPYAGSGRLILRDGRYKAYGQNLQIESGALIFNGPLDNPVLDLRATRTASDGVVAGIHLTGTPVQPQSDVFSDPTLGDAESLSYLLTGRPLVSANAEQGDMLNQAAFALGLSTAGSVVSRISNQLGLDTLAVKGGSGEQQIVAGKRLGSRLLVEYAYGIVDNLGTLLLRYQLNSRMVLESRSGSVNNVDVVYSVKKD
jgi:translocation and assembly module TamB